MERREFELPTAKEMKEALEDAEDPITPRAVQAILSGERGVSARRLERMARSRPHWAVWDIVSALASRRDAYLARQDAKRAEGRSA